MTEPLQFDLGQSSFAAALQKIRDSKVSDETQLAFLQCKGADFLGCGLRAKGTVQFHGDLGDFACMSFRTADATVEGSVGNFFGHSIHSGSITVRGHAKNGVGTLGTGGLISIYGNASDRVAAGLQGADIVVRGSVGSLAGLGMREGSLVIGGNAGADLGRGMRAGTIYLRGDAESISPDIEEVRMREPDRLKIGLLMLKAGIKSAGKEFRVFRPAQ